MIDADRIQQVRCASKARYGTFNEARRQPGQFVYVCPVCGCFHRTSKPLCAADQRRLIERIFGKVTPANVTRFNEMDGRKDG